MKILLPLALTLFAGSALACPGDSAKQAAAPATKPAVAAKAAPADAKAGTKLAEKAAAEPRKTAPM